jgi:hypothetical protein
LLLRFSGEIPTIAKPVACAACGLRYAIGQGKVLELDEG